MLYIKQQQSKTKMTETTTRQSFTHELDTYLLENMDRLDHMFGGFRVTKHPIKYRAKTCAWKIVYGAGIGGDTKILSVILESSRYTVYKYDDMYDFMDSYPGYDITKTLLNKKDVHHVIEILENLHRR